MEAKEIIVYFNKIKVNIKLSGVMSESADACIVPQFDHGISQKLYSKRDSSKDGRD
jgi:hypothetical protein